MNLSSASTEGAVSRKAKFSCLRLDILTRDSLPREIVIEPGRLERNYWLDLWWYRELFRVLAWRDLAVHYKQTIIGGAWAICAQKPYTAAVRSRAAAGAPIRAKCWSSAPSRSKTAASAPAASD
jgi:hypothetical protein